MKSMLTFAMVATGQEMIKEKKFFKVRVACVQPPLTSKKSIFLRCGAAVHRLGQGKDREFHFKSGKTEIFRRSQGEMRF